MAAADGWYHVFGRGIERRDIFADARDRGHLLELYAQAHERYRFRIHAYALMDNHYHAIIQTPDANLSQGMQWLHGSYSAWFNARHNRVGPLFQGRYRAIPVENGGWAYALSFYVHLNPVRVEGLGLDKQGRVLECKGWSTPTPEQVTERTTLLRAYPWSSYRAYAGHAEAPLWLECGTLLARAPGPARGKCAAYRAEAGRMLTQGVEPARVDRLREAVAIGSREFVLKLKRQALGRNLAGVAGTRELRRRVEVEMVRGWVEQIKGEPWKLFARRHGDWGCALFLWGARRLCGLTLRELGAAAGGVAFSAVSKLVRRFEQQAAQDAALREVQDRLISMSNVEP
jgi:putative transposase